MAEDRQIATMHIASAPGIAKGHKYAFRWYITSDMQMEYLVDYLRKDNIESEKIAFLHLNDDYGKGSLQAFSKHLDSLGLDKKVFSESYQPDQSNFRSILAKVKNFNPDVIALVGYSSSLGTLVKQIRQLDIEAKLIGDDAVSYPQILSAAGSAANGFVFAGLPIENISKDKQFYKTYTDMFDKEPNDFSVFTYGAAKILSTCITADDYKGSDDLARCLSSNEFETPLGTVRFDKDHNGTVNLILQTIESGNVRMLKNGI